MTLSNSMKRKESKILRQKILDEFIIYVLSYLPLFKEGPDDPGNEVYIGQKKTHTTEKVLVTYAG